MCVVDMCDKHVLSIWDWEKERMIAKTTVSTYHLYSPNELLI